MHDKIVILDFGSQYTQLIARRIRELGVFCAIYAFDAKNEDILANAKGIILSGGPQSVHAGDKDWRIPEWVFAANLPILGICYGMQALAVEFGGKVIASDKREFGHANIDIIHDNLFLAPGSYDVWMSHGDSVAKLPKDFITIGESQNAPVAFMQHKIKQIYGCQFHPEVTHTACGKDILAKFVIDICNAKNDWTTANIIDESIAEIKNQIGSANMVLGLSGGVDSSVVAMLAHKAIGKQLTCIFVDNGLLRQNELQEVKQLFANKFGLNIKFVEAQQVFLEALQGVSCPEEKRKIIGRTFIDVFALEAEKIPNCKFLAQGTIYPDVIESAGAATGKAHVIKSHHNVGGLPEKMHLSLCEPLKLLFKDEVRQIGMRLGLPQSLIMRHPFPGPGLGVRILGEVKPEFADILRQADKIFIDMLHESNLYATVSQAFAVFLPVKSVGVMGDMRAYEYVIALRAVKTIDFMTATWAPLPYEFLGAVANRIMNEVKMVARVTYDISGKPPATIEWE